MGLVIIDLFGKPAMKSKANIFTLGSRNEVLNSSDYHVLIPHIVVNEGKKLPFEVLFKSFMRLIADNVTRHIMNLTKRILILGRILLQFK